MRAANAAHSGDTIGRLLRDFYRELRLALSSANV